MHDGTGNRVGIEALNVYGGRAAIDTRSLFDARGLDAARFDNLMMRRKSVGLPCEDAVTNAVNAARPLVEAMTPEERDGIDLLITASESGIDFGKSLATWVHRYLGLKSTCRVFEVKQACYAATAGLQMAAGQIAAGLTRGKALVIATDIAWPAGGLAYAELSQGVAAAAMVVGDAPAILDLDTGASGIHAAEVLDTSRPDDVTETGDTDLSLMSYLDSLEGAVADYLDRVEGADFRTSFDYLAFHTPFGGMVRGAHRNLMRRLYRAGPQEIDADFERRLGPSLGYCSEVGNAYSATLYIALAGLIERVADTQPCRVGLFSYGSGSCGEFFSGIVPAGAAARLAAMGIAARLEEREALDVETYDRIVAQNGQWRMGLRDHRLDRTPFAALYDRTMRGRGLLTLTAIEGYRRCYDWS